jgi:hypothetical protein
MPKSKPKPRKKSAAAKPRKPAARKPGKPKKAESTASAKAPPPKKTAKSAPKPKGDFVPSINYASLPEGQYGTTLLAEFAAGYRVLVAPFDDNDISIPTERESARAGNVTASGLGRFGKMTIELQPLTTPPLGVPGMFLQVVATLAPDYRRIDITRGAKGGISHEVHETPLDQMTYIVLKGPDIQKVRILDGAGLVIQKIGVRSA